MKVKPTKIIKSCTNCINNVEDYPPHTCDMCDALDTPDYYMWGYKKPNSDIMKLYNDMKQIDQTLSRMKQGWEYVCGNTDTLPSYLNKK